MTEGKKQAEPINVVTEEEDEIDLLALARTICKGKKLIVCIVAIFTFATAVLSLFMTNTYTVEAVIKPVSTEKGGGKLASLASQFGGLATLAGIAMPGTSTSAELVKLLESNVIRKNIIEKYNLLPVLFPKRWDEEKKTWKKKSFANLNPLVLINKLRPIDPNMPKKEPGVPDIWDGIRELDKDVKINYNMKEDIVTVTVSFRNPEMAEKIANYFITELGDLISSEAKRIAVVNKEYLEKQLLETNDNLVQQKIYSLIAEKIETMMMAEVKEGFAFKVLDPPMAPDKKSKPKRAQMVIVAFMVSFFLGIFITLFREYIKKIKIKSAGGQNEK